MYTHNTTLQVAAAVICIVFLLFWGGLCLFVAWRGFGKTKAQAEEVLQLCEIVVKDSGKTLENAMAGEIWPVCEKLRWTIKHGEKYLVPERMPNDMLRHKSATIEYVPLGVVGAIIPWNYPLQNVMNQAIPALFSGNGYAVKPSE